MASRYILNFVMTDSTGPLTVGVRRVPQAGVRQGRTGSPTRYTPAYRFAQTFAELTFLTRSALPGGLFALRTNVQYLLTRVMEGGLKNDGTPGGNTDHLGEEELESLDSAARRPGLRSRLRITVTPVESYFSSFSSQPSTTLTLTRRSTSCFLI